MEEHEPGVWMVRTATVIPDNERWLHQPKAYKEEVPAAILGEVMARVEAILFE